MIRIKHFLVFFGLSFLLFSFSNCGSSQGSKGLSFESNPPFTISEIFSQKWVAGTQEGGSGINVHISFSELTEGVQIDQIYFRKKMIAAQQKPNMKSTYIGYFRNDMGRDVVMGDSPVKEATNTPPKDFPFDLKENEAVISYTMKGSMAYFRTSDIVEKPLIAYPSTKPKDID